MNGLDVTREVLVHRSIIDRMDQIDNVASHFFHDLMMTFNANQKKVFGWVDGGPLHDPVTIVSLLDPKCVTYQAMNVTIDVSGGPSYGRTNCDRYDYLHLPKNAYVATGDRRRCVIGRSSKKGSKPTHERNLCDGVAECRPLRLRRPLP
jgi:ribosylpyrimidine nucleosidase